MLLFGKTNITFLKNAFWISQITKKRTLFFSKTCSDKKVFNCYFRDFWWFLIKYSINQSFKKQYVPTALPFLSRLQQLSSRSHHHSLASLSLSPTTKTYSTPLFVRIARHQKKWTCPGLPLPRSTTCNPCLTCQTSLRHHRTVY